ncbi:hypothetical protein FIBSPDRAFT_793672 [Athelia psychrophila]|uniref:Translation initiation factor IF2/IF5 domain-containing protein n=1 Tax=Athelia psychrophila TaxID=1759441 RepID=A0A166FPV4_9AGAM|nr:hypothetical protein FIBSPDRAFT_793672 [Fibularhizoctonia sp. CBS 109695]
MASEEPLFDPSLKKKKKKVLFQEDPLGAEADPTTPAPTSLDNTTTTGEAVDLGPSTAHEQMQRAVNGGGDDAPKEDEDMFADMKKKKKKKKEIPMDFQTEDAPGTSTPDNDAAAAPAASEDLDFSDMKKKKKSKSKKIDLEAFEKELQETAAKDADDDGDIDGEHLADIDEAELGEDPFAQTDGPVGLDADNEPWLKSDRDYTYPELLHRFYASLHASNPALLTSSGKRYTIAPPSIHREGNKKSIFANVTDICKRMHRQPEHVIQFLFSEMGTTGSVDGAGRLVIKGRFQQKQVENVLRRYIVEYVTCKTCKSPDTLLTKENRIFFMSCESCGSRRSVNPIKSGFQAQVGKRSKNKTG